MAPQAVAVRPTDDRGIDPDPCSDPAPRHKWNAQFCDRLQRVAWGRSAAACELPAGSRRAAVFCLPVFCWDTPSIAVGRKSRGDHGEVLLLPIRVHWTDKSGNPVGDVAVVPTGTSTTLHWSAVGFGRSTSGTATLVAAPGGTPPPVAQTAIISVPPNMLISPVMGRPAGRSFLARLAEDGTAAQWDLLGSLERNLNWAFERAHTAVRSELDAPPLSYETAESIKDELMFGTSGRSHLPWSLRLIERCLRPKTFARVDPQRYVRTSLISASETAIRRYLGDPHVGRKLRRLFSERAWESAEELAAECQRRWPRAHIGEKRLANALTAGVVSTTPLSEREQDDRHNNVIS